MRLFGSAPFIFPCPIRMLKISNTRLEQLNEIYKGKV